MSGTAAGTTGTDTRVAYYVYGVVAGSDAGADLGRLPAVGDDPKAGVAFVTHGRIAAAVSPLRADRPLGTPDDLRAHADVLNALASTGAAVLPFRFGTVLDGEQAVADDVLAGAHDAFAAALERLAGRAQFTLRAVYEQDAVLREVLAERPDIVELRDSVAGMPEAAAFDARVRLGELVAQAVQARRERDAATVEARLGPFADASVVSEPTAEDALADVSFLVSDARRAQFEQAAEDLAREWHGRARLRLLGPLAPYDFVDEAMEQAEADTGAGAAADTGTGEAR